MIQKISIGVAQRVAVGTTTMLLFLFLALISHHPIGSWLFLGVLTATVGLALWEYYEMALTRGYSPYMRIGLWASVAYLVSLFLSLYYHELTELHILVFLAAILVFFYQNYRQPQENLIANSAVTLFCFVYITLSLSYLLLVTYFPFEKSSQDGRWWLIYAVVVTKMTDVGGYIVGKWRGKTPLAPQISPKKSVEGAIGGLALAMIAALFIPILHPEGLQLTWAQCLVFALSLGTVGQLGDLLESLLKRDAGVKHSSTLPGLGGTLDIFDSMILSLPLFYFLMLGMEL